MKYVTIEGGKKLSGVIIPMKATLSDAPPFDSPEWIFEIKWDGYRAIAELDGANTRLYSRNGLSFAKAYPKVFDELNKIKHKAVIDGEVVVIGSNGLPSFQAIQNYKSTQKLPIQYYVFDILSLNGKDLTKLKLVERKEILKGLLPESNIVRYCDHIEGEGIALYEQAKKMNLEGIIAKKADSKYYPDKRSKEWLKIKNMNTDDFVIVGWTDPQSSRQHLGALMLAHNMDGRLKYAGTVGTGFTAKLLKELYDMLKPTEIKTPPVKEYVKEKGMHWVTPRYICQVQYVEFTNEGHVRHPSYMGLRKDKSYGQ